MVALRTQLEPSYDLLPDDLDWGTVFEWFMMNHYTEDAALGERIRTAHEENTFDGDWDRLYRETRFMAKLENHEFIGTAYAVYPRVLEYLKMENWFFLNFRNDEDEVFDIMTEDMHRFYRKYSVFHYDTSAMWHRENTFVNVPVLNLW